MSMTFDYNQKKFETNWVNDVRYQQKNEGKMSEKILKGAEEMKKKWKRKVKTLGMLRQSAVHQVPSVGKASQNQRER